MTRGELLAAVRAFIDVDPDPATRAELEDLVARARWDELEDRFRTPLAFGTAGLRGVVGAGPARMNAAVVEKTTRAVVEYLLGRDPGARSRPVVVGYDGRTTSAAFARVAIAALDAAGIPARYFEGPSPTPLVAFAARELAASAAVAVTASHNPAEYNGYKLYGPDAIQITAPADAEIEELAERLGPKPPAARASLATPLDVSMEARYLASIEAARPKADVDRSFPIVYTPLHGVGGRLALQALGTAGFSGVSVVREQAEPDGAFPTAPSPNPEEPGVLARALALAEERGAALVLANDPDADRLAVCVPRPSGGFRPLTGNQIGALLGDFVLAGAPTLPRPLVVSTVVSSPLLGVIARARGARYETTLTGFKWIWSAALQLERQEGVKFAFGCEEAIGFSVGGAVRDKDGISAAVFFAELAARCRAAGKTVIDELGALYLRHGLWASAQHAVALHGADGVRAIAAAVDAAVTAPPRALAGRPVEGVTDFRVGAEGRPPWLSAAPVIRFDLGGGEHVLLRPSGTEPKLKIYADLRRDVAAPASLWDDEAALAAEAHAAAVELAGHLGLA
jgi:phosphomannomutase